MALIELDPSKYSETTPYLLKAKAKFSTLLTGSVTRVSISPSEKILMLDDVK
jgi:hypothetical protein